MRKIIKFNYKKSESGSLGFYFAFNSDLSPEAIAFVGTRSFGVRIFGKEEVIPEPKKKRPARKSVKKVTPVVVDTPETLPEITLETFPEIEEVKEVKEVKKRTSTKKKKESTDSPYTP